ncbi:MAG: rhodanese-related sulfurtransferase [Bacteroidota bacterium]|nr:rhodanese-related sulfurtransferase [Bacteroidota bacterium]
MILHNKISSKELKEKIKNSTEQRTTISFYKYHHLSDPQAFRDELFIKWSELGVLGRIYVAKEGINAQLSLPSENFETFKSHLYSYDFLNGIRLNIAVEDDGKSFFKLAIKVRHKIVADGIEDPNFDVTKIGVHLKAEDFNALIDNPDTIVVDMRNHYESEIGHFEKAVLPDVLSFREQLPKVAEMLSDKKDKPVLMYCTGGIRCEKASAYMLYRGFKEVYQLEGGIIKYANEIKEKGLPNKFHGKNFVFDERLGEHISPEVIAKCHQCGTACDTHTNCANVACNLLFIQCPSCKEKYSNCCDENCQSIAALPEEEQKALRRGQNKGRLVFNKGKKLKTG